MMRLFAFLTLSVTAVAACSPYDPDLGDDPFLCGTTDPKCPDGYAAVNINATRCECHRQQAGLPDGGTGYNCANDPYEGSGKNDTMQTATTTAIGPSGNTTTYNTLAVCPDADQDWFSMDIQNASSTIEADVAFDSGRTPPAVDILNGSGVTLHPTVTAGQPGHITATVATTATGLHYVQVKAGTGTMNLSVNYSIHMTVTSP